MKKEREGNKHEGKERSIGERGEGKTKVRCLCTRKNIKCEQTPEPLVVLAAEKVRKDSL